ncbi:MAG: hypothetical protein LBD67_01550 [Candidatus Accumulibacter sp.]|nr:hypothetical protein [Accumulibacter sp.]
MSLSIFLSCFSVEEKSKPFENVVYFLYFPVFYLKQSIKLRYQAIFSGHHIDFFVHIGSSARGREAAAEGADPVPHIPLAKANRPRKIQRLQANVRA